MYYASYCGFFDRSAGRSAGRTPQKGTKVTHRANRFTSPDTKRARDSQKGVESRRSAMAFYAQQPKPKHPMTQYSCDICGLTFSTSWLDHCPSCGSRALSINISLDMLEAN